MIMNVPGASHMGGRMGATYTDSSKCSDGHTDQCQLKVGQFLPRNLLLRSHGNCEQQASCYRQPQLPLRPGGADAESHTYDEVENADATTRKVST